MLGSSGQPLNISSKKNRALLGILALSPRQISSRERLASLLWGDHGEDQARASLRQSLATLRREIGPADLDVLRTSEDGVGLDLSLLHVDALEFLDAAQNQDTAPLARAAKLWSGPPLQDLALRTAAFEDWSRAETERLIAAASTVFERLSQTTQGRARIDYATRLVALDPLRETSQRELMRAYAGEGDNGLALKQYETCRKLLAEELGVEPREVTSNLFRWIQLQEQVEPEPPVIPVSQYPQIALLGREDELARLRSWWRRGDKAKGLRLLLVEGESGVGKTRLIEEFIDRLRREQRINLLRGRSSTENTPAGSRPFEEALHSALHAQTGYVRRALAELSPATLADLSGIFPDLSRQRPDLPERREDLAFGELQTAVGRLLAELSGPFEAGESRIPLILFLDDLHLAGGDTFLLLEYLALHHADLPLHVLGCHLTESPRARGPIAALAGRFQELERPVDHLQLGPLSSSDLRRLHQDLIESGPEERLPRFLERVTGGLPVALVEILFDRYEAHELRYQADGRWRWTGDTALDDETPLALDDLIWGRIRRLPRSARRLLTLAAVIGQRFDADVLARIEHEDISVVWANLRIWIERHMVRPVNDPWAEVDHYPSPSPKDSTEIRAPLEFCHRRLRTVIYRRLPAERRKAIHGQVAHELRARLDHDPSTWAEPLAYHFSNAERWEPAVRCHLQAGQLAADQPAPVRALLHFDRALALLPRADLAHGEAQEIGEAIHRGRQRVVEVLSSEDHPFVRDEVVDVVG
ncbi:MAG: AAA family ATPase [Acidobacteria bacterium]|nr:AAA family ATPase [Acidobacteriota bacterium]